MRAPAGVDGARCARRDQHAGTGADHGPVGGGGTVVVAGAGTEVAAGAGAEVVDAPEMLVTPDAVAVVLVVSGPPVVVTEAEGVTGASGAIEGGVVHVGSPRKLGDAGFAQSGTCQGSTDGSRVCG